MNFYLIDVVLAANRCPAYNVAPCKPHVNDPKVWYFEIQHVQPALSIQDGSDFEDFFKISPPMNFWQHAPPTPKELNA